MNKLYLSAIVLLLAVPVSAQEAQPGESMSVGLVIEAAAIGSGIENREPVGVDTLFDSGVGEVFCWTRIAGAPDTTAVTFVWFRNGKEMARVDLPVRSPLWRTWSSKHIRSDWTGAWEVRVLDSNGEVLKSLTFTVSPGPPPDTQPPDTPAPDTGAGE